MNSFDDPRITQFLDFLREGHTVDSARKKAELNWKLLYSLKNGVPEFADAWDQALGSGRRTLSRVKAMTEAEVEAFLTALASGMTVSEAAEVSHINSASFYKRRHRDPEFAKRWKEAARHGLESTLARNRETEPAIFLRELRAGKTSREAALLAGKDITTFYRLKRKDPVFAKEWNRIAQSPPPGGASPAAAASAAGAFKPGKGSKGAEEPRRPD
ncbi:MAG: hypothetical protein LBQ12_10085, partial [Deltaproteobacteria bacterium]|nr:hypothetical protein [Deltaproteobacteria bacterium]